MDEYIKRKPLIEDISSLSVTLCGNEIFGTLAKHSVVKMIYEQPAADVVEVVRCKDCRDCIDAHQDGFMYCMRPIEAEDYSETGYCYPLEVRTKIYDFCSYGKRKDGADAD